MAEAVNYEVPSKSRDSASYVDTPLDGQMPLQSVPFLTPPAGRPPRSDTASASYIRRRLSTPQTLDALQRIAGKPPYYKRLMDLVGSATLIILLSPLLVTVALLIKCNDGGPILFWQRRVGLRGREFWFPKFRSMMLHADRLVRMLTARNEHAKPTQTQQQTKDTVTFKMRDDPRITWIGRLIRRGSIDELPQLWCVFKGDMSLVGPRPALPTEVAQYTPADRRRLEVTPGLTCIWQVSGRGDVPFPRQVEMDVEYIERQGFWFDLQLLLRTIPAVLFGHGAY